MREKSEGGHGEGDKGDTCRGPPSGFSSPLPPPLAAPPMHLGSENEAGSRESRERVGEAGSSLADRSRLHGRQERWLPPPHWGYLTRSVGWRRPQGASGVSSPQGDSGGLRLLRRQPGGPRHGLEWGTPDSSQNPTAPKISGLDPFFRHTSFGKKLFLAFFPFPLQFGGRPRPR